MKLKVDKFLCIGCGVCISVCPKKVLKFEGKKELGIKILNAVVAFPERCISCKKCMEACPAHAIKINK